MIGKKRLITQTMVGLTLVLTLTFLAGLGAVPAVRAAPLLVQQVSGGGIGTSYTITLTGVTKGDMIVVAESEGFQPVCACSSYPFTVTDTQSNGYTMVVQQTGGFFEEGSIWYATASSGGTDVITVTLTGCQTFYTDNPFFLPPHNCGNNGAVAYELSGFTPAGVVSSPGSGTTGCCSVTSFTPPTGSFVIAAAGAGGYTSPWTAGSGYALSTNDSPDAEAQAEYLVGWSGGPTTAPMTPTVVPGFGLSWVEAAAAFPVEPVVTTTGTATVTTTQTLTATATSTRTATVTQTSTATVNTGTCATESPSTFGPALVIKADTITTTAGPTITDTTIVTTTSTAIVITTVTQTVTSTSTATVISTQFTCTPPTSPPTGVPQFPLAGLSALMLVALLLPALLLMKKRRSGKSLA